MSKIGLGVGGQLSLPLFGAFQSKKSTTADSDLPLKEFPQLHRDIIKPTPLFLALFSLHLRLNAYLYIESDLHTHDYFVIPVLIAIINT